MKALRSIKSILFIAALFLGSAIASHAQQASDYDLPAVGGYDLVSYQQVNGPLRGTGFQAAAHKGVTYLFATEANKKTFLANPERYLPAYNGFCAYGVAVGQKFNTDPTVYEVIDGKLYLNLDHDIQKKWNEDKPGNIAKANKNWVGLK